MYLVYDYDHYNSQNIPIMRHQDVSLLMVFDAIMTEGSITRAADRLMMTQPAVSNALSRMRLAWKDELFVKHGRNIRPTLHAQNLWEQIRNPLKELDNVLTPHSFEPATAKRSFYVSAADVGIDIVWKPLRKIIEKQAPNINIYAVPYTMENSAELLNNAEAELVFGPITTMPKRINSEALFYSRHVCVMRADHPLTKKPLTLKPFASADHLLVSLSGNIDTEISETLRQRGINRRIAMTVNHFSALGPILSDSNLIAIAPSIAVKKEIFNGELAVVDCPIDVPQVQIGYFWHQRQDQDQGLIWLRQHMTHIIKEHMQQHYLELDNYLEQKSLNKSA